MALIPPGIFPAMFEHPNRQRFRDQYSIGSHKLVMYAGVTNAFQRMDYLLEAFKAALQGEPSLMLMVVSPLKDEVDLPKNQALASSLGIQDRIVWVEGHALSDLADYLGAADVTVIPRPDIPGYPLKLLNYLAAGRPVVCFESAAKGVEHMHDVFAVPDRDVRAMGEAIVRLTQDPDLAEQLATNGRNTVLSYFDWEVLCTQIETVYSKVIELERPTVSQVEGSSAVKTHLESSSRANAYVRFGTSEHQ